MGQKRGWKSLSLPVRLFQVQQLTPNSHCGWSMGYKTHYNVTSANFRCRIAFSVSSSAILSSLTYNQGSKRKTHQHSTCSVILINCEWTRKSRKSQQRTAGKVKCETAQTPPLTAETRQAHPGKGWPAVPPTPHGSGPSLPRRSWHCQQQPHGLI